MAEETGARDPGLVPLKTGDVDPRIEALMDGARTTAYFQALLFAEEILGGVRLGKDGPPRDERIRLRPSISLGCPPSDLESIETENKRLLFTTTFLGLYGSDSPLPNSYIDHFTRISLEPRGQRVRDYLDIFHHRLHSLLYRGWKKSRPVSTDDDDVEALYDRVLALTGYAKRLRLGGTTPPKLAEARLRTLRCRTAGGLEALLKQRLGYTCAVEQLCARTVGIPEAQRARLGQNNCRLGIDLVAGTTIVDRNKIKLKIDATNYKMWLDLAPSGQDRKSLTLAMNSYLRDPVDYDIDVNIPQDKIPHWKMSERQALGRGLWLGRTTDKAQVSWKGRFKPRVMQTSRPEGLIPIDTIPNAPPPS